MYVLSLGAWRNGFSMVMFSVTAVLVITVMNHRNYTAEAKSVRDTLTQTAAYETIAPENQQAVIDAVAAIPEQHQEIGQDKPPTMTFPSTTIF